MAALFRLPGREQCSRVPGGWGKRKHSRRLLAGLLWLWGGLLSVPGWTQTASSAASSTTATTASQVKTPAGAGLAVIGAALKGDLKALRVLLAQGRDPDEANAKGRTALHVAAFYGNLRTARLLLAAGADADAADTRQITPLMLAATNGRLEMVRLLLAQGADLTLQDKTGRTAQEAAARAGFAAVEDMLKALAPVGKKKKKG